MKKMFIVAAMFVAASMVACCGEQNAKDGEKACCDKEKTECCDKAECDKAECKAECGLGALKYFILKVDPRKNMMFDPKESIDFNGNTGPFIQYTHARICSVLRKAAEMGITLPNKLNEDLQISDTEGMLIQSLASYPDVVAQAGKEFSPALIANYIYDLVKQFNSFYHDFSILKEENEDVRAFRLLLSKSVAKVVKSGMGLLGIEVPERM